VARLDGAPRRGATQGSWSSGAGGRPDRVVAGALLDRHPAQLGELLERGAASEAAPAAGLDAPERHLRLVVDGRGVDVADAALDPAGNLHRLVDVLAEDRGGATVLGVVGGLHRLAGAAHRHGPHDRAERRFLVDAHLRGDAGEHGPGDQARSSWLVARVADRELGGALGELDAERLSEGAVGRDPLGRHAHLAGVHERAEAGGAGGGLEVGVGEHDTSGALPPSSSRQRLKCSAT
jgi:hypothetical protein